MLTNQQRGRNMNTGRHRTNPLCLRNIRALCCFCKPTYLYLCIHKNSISLSPAKILKSPFRGWQTTDRVSNKQSRQFISAHSIESITNSFPVMYSPYSHCCSPSFIILPVFHLQKKRKKKGKKKKLDILPCFFLASYHYDYNLFHRTIENNTQEQSFKWWMVHSQYLYISSFNHISSRE